MKAMTSFGGKIPGWLGKAGRGFEAFGAEMPGLFDTGMWKPGRMNPVYHTRNAGWENFLTAGLAGRDQDNWRGTMKTWKRVSQLYPNATGIESYMRGQADVNLVIDITDPATGRKTRERVHVPVGLWSHGKHPSHRGQAHKTIRTR